MPTRPRAPRSARPSRWPNGRARLSTTLFALFLLSGLIPIALLVPVAVTQYRAQLRFWTLPSVEHALDASLGANRSAVLSLCRHLALQGESLVAAHPLEEGARADSAFADALLAGAENGEFVDAAAVYTRDGGGFRFLVASRSTSAAEFRPEIHYRAPRRNEVGPEAPTWYPVRSPSGDWLAVPCWLYGAGDDASPPEPRGALVLGLSLGPGYFDRLERGSVGLSFYRRLAEVSHVLQRGYLLGIVLALLVSLYASFLLARRVARDVATPVESMAQGFRALARREPVHALDGGRFPELQSLARAFTSMQEQLDSYERGLREMEQVRGARETARFVAHEIRNSLTPVQAALGVLGRRLEQVSGDERERAQKAFGLIEREAARMSRLASAFSEYAKMPEPRPEPLELEPLIRRAAEAQLRDGVSLAIEIEPGLPRAQFDRDEFERVVGNLVKNAVESFVGAGAIEIAAQRTGSQVEIRIRDNGTGMDAETLRQVWQPGYTTKESGSGLGLALVRRTVAQYGGRVAMESAPGQGTIVRILLPALAGSNANPALSTGHEGV